MRTPANIHPAPPQQMDRYNIMNIRKTCKLAHAHRITATPRRDAHAQAPLRWHLDYGMAMARWRRSRFLFYYTIPRLPSLSCPMWCVHVIRNALACITHSLLAGAERASLRSVKYVYVFINTARKSFLLLLWLQCSVVLVSLSVCSHYFINARRRRRGCKVCSMHSIVLFPMCIANTQNI